MDSILLTNFRSFNGENLIDLAPLTILTGENNSGKSSIIKAILLLKDYFDSQDQTLLRFNGDLSFKHKLNSFSNTLSWNSKQNVIELGFLTNRYQVGFKFFHSEKQDHGLLAKFQITSTKSNQTLKLERSPSAKNIFNLNVSQSLITELAGKETHISEDLLMGKAILQDYQFERTRLKKKISQTPKNSPLFNELINQDQEIQVRIKLLKEKIRKSESEDSKRKSEILFNPKIDIREYDKSGGIRTIPKIIRYALSKYMEDDYRTRNDPLYQQSMLQIDKAIEELLQIYPIHLGPTRAHQARVYLREDKNIEINTAVNTYSKYPLIEESKEKRFLKKWLNEFQIGIDIIPKNIQGEAGYLGIEIPGKKEPINLADLGFGSGQILTILLKIVNQVNPNNPDNRKQKLKYILVEEPESNLHPKFQSLLGELFYEAFKTFGIRFILEIHSEYLIRRLQLLVAKQQALSDDIIIYYIDPFDKDQKRSIRPIKIKEEDGKLTDVFGKGFYDEADSHAIELYKITNTESLT